MGSSSLPNLITAARIALSALVFFGLAAAAGLFGPADRDAWAWASAAVLAVAALSDFVDGWLARRLGATSAFGAMLDPIADKIAIAAAVLGLALLRPEVGVAVPGFLILFRELFVSGLREAGGAQGVRLPVTRLAKWKTTVQLVALTLEILAVPLPALALVADALMWLAAGLTLWTGWGYLRAAASALR